MSHHYHEHTTTTQREQDSPKQVPNSAGGFSFALDRWKMLERFLILGSLDGSYYASPRDLTKTNLKNIIKLIDKDGLGVLHMVSEISDKGRAPSNDPALLVLAACTNSKDVEVRKAAMFDVLPKVARIGTHLFHFASYMEAYRGWGRIARAGIANWYTSRDNQKLAYDLIKYRQRDGWTHRDLLRLSHPQTADQAKASLFRFATHADDTSHPLTEGFLKAQAATTPKQTAKLIAEYGLPREALRTEHLSSPEVWQALLDAQMPITALIRNLATMTRIDLLKPLSDASKQVVERLEKTDYRRARVHPLTILMAERTYTLGQGHRGTSWEPVPTIADALADAFYRAFDAVQPTNKRWLLALDVSGSMTWHAIAGKAITPAEASAALALVTAKTESQYHICGFSTQFKPLGITAKMTLPEAMHTAYAGSFGGTDCALPMIWATKKKIEVDVFTVFTDNETWAGKIHPHTALKRYRKEINPQAKLIVVGMTSNGFTIADPDDTGMMDVVGFDASVPSVMADFATA